MANILQFPTPRPKDGGMIIIVKGDDLSDRFVYDTRKDSMCLCPGAAERPAVVAALTEALGFLTVARPIKVIEPA